MPTFGSLFSGVGGMDLGLERAGWKCKFQVELDDWRRQVLTRHWPEVPKWKDVRDFPGGDCEVAEGIGRASGRRDAESGVDLLCGGFPCQDLSVVGKRAGLAGGRSGLFFEFARIAGELRPQYLLIENVPGLLSSAQGLDFAIVLDTLDELGYGLAWRILNSQYFGVPQRRRRVFIVGYLGGPCPPEILFESEGGGGNPTASRETRERLAATLEGGAPGTRRDDEAGLVPELAYTLDKHAGQVSQREGQTNLISATVTAKWGTHGSGGRSGDECQNLLCAPVDADGVREATGLPGWLDSCTRCPDGRRYAALGDAVTVPVAEWIGRRLKGALR